MILDEDYAKERSDTSLVECLLAVLTDEVSMEEVQMTYNNMFGTHDVTTLRIIGECGGHTLHILVDTGSTISFIKASTTKSLNCPLLSTTPILVKVVMQKMVSSQQMDSFCWSMQQTKF